MIESLHTPALPLPHVAVPPVDTPATKESTKFDDRVLDYKIKRAGTFGGLGVAGCLYLVGVIAILKVLGIWPFDCSPFVEVTEDFSRVLECAVPMIGENSWHGLAGVMLALFSVPTVLLISILRTISPKREPLPDTLYTAVADKLSVVLERFFDARK
ncbi:hypothetical protein [Mitsuaria sp. GD03876]|uniref:hypothetical protein n=1 Tax=Mitsuaria sp. GD03876 TaxID=2975399 RepID=UPI00244739C5|nr:hypothetical protein [Mitsuaria sp. GD03876]MDH0866235.1 hypothetical protein [Mitsuaria sp. GD03876]